jgi:hypothetical protein
MSVSDLGPIGLVFAALAGFVLLGLALAPVIYVVGFLMRRRRS